MVMVMSGCGRIGFGGAANDCSCETWGCGPSGGCLSGEVEAVYLQNGTQWNDYVRNSDPNRGAYHQDDEACTDVDPPGRRSCIPAALMRKVPLSGTSCDGRTGTDALGVFEWFCDDQGDQPTLYSRGFREGKGLKDLIGAELRWRQNHIVVLDGSDSVDGPDSAWWDNPIVSLADPAFRNGTGADSVIDLSEAGAVYVLPSDQDSVGYRISADRVSVTTLQGAMLRFVSNGQNNCSNNGTTDNRVCLIGSPEGPKFIWIEGDFDVLGSASEDRGIYLFRTRFSRVHGVRVSNADGYGVRVDESDSNVIDEVIAINNDSGVTVSGGSHQVFSRLTVANSADTGVYFVSGGGIASLNVFSDIVSANNGFGLRLLTGGESNTFAHVTLTNNAIGLRENLSRTSLHNCVAVNNNTGLEASGAASTFSHLVAGYGNVGVRVVPPASDIRFLGVLVADKSGDDCQLAGGTNPGIDTDCNPTDSSAFIKVGTMATPPQFGGAIAAPGDAVNTSDADGTALGSSISDWSRFENRYRGWGLDGGAAFPSDLHRQECLAADTCRIWDWQLRSSDPILRNRTGNGQAENSPFVAGMSCPPEVHGDVVATDQQAPSNIYLLNAKEILLDHIGDEDGLCETDESCLYTPNFGAYQGHGVVSTVPCIFASGTVANVVMYAYATNGI